MQSISMIKETNELVAENGWGTPEWLIYSLFEGGEWIGEQYSIENLICSYNKNKKNSRVAFFSGTISMIPVKYLLLEKFNLPMIATVSDKVTIGGVAKYACQYIE